MNISAAGCTPLKPQASFGKEKSYEEIVSKTDKVNSTFVESGSIKGPVAVAASVALAGIVAFASGKKIANVVSTITKDRAGDVVMGALKKGGEAVKNGSAKLIEDAPATKLAKVKTFAGKTINKGADVIGENFKKYAYMGTSKITDQTQKNAKALGNLIGAGAVVTMVPGILAKDSDGNGVKDIAQKDQNAYTGTAYENTKNKVEEGAKKVGVLADLVETLM